MILVDSLGGPQGCRHEGWVSSSTVTRDGDHRESRWRDTIEPRLLVYNLTLNETHVHRCRTEVGTLIPWFGGSGPPECRGSTRRSSIMWEGRPRFRHVREDPFVMKQSLEIDGEYQHRLGRGSQTSTSSCEGGPPSHRTTSMR